MKQKQTSLLIHKYSKLVGLTGLGKLLLNAGHCADDGRSAAEKNQAPRLVAGERKRVILRRPALKALPNLSLNVSDTLRATRAK